jgi:hypothetical protein
LPAQAQHLFRTEKKGWAGPKIIFPASDDKKRYQIG